MILQALVELAEAEKLCEDPDFEYKPVAWYVRLKSDGTLINIESTLHEPPGMAGSKKKVKPVAKQLLVPRQPIRTSGVKAFLLVDKAEYVFGVDPEGGTDPKTAERARQFREAVEACAESTDDQGAKAAASYLRAIASGKAAAKLPESCGPGDLFAIIVGTGADFVHLRPAVKDYWKQQRAQSEAGAQANDQQPKRCLITGNTIRGEVGLFPLIKRVPGGSMAGVALVSFNTGAFESHGWQNNDNAPFSRTAAEAAATALNRLLNPDTPKPTNPNEKLPRRRLSLGGDTVLVYWAPKAQQPESLDFFADVVLAEPPDPERVADLYKSVWRGKRAIIDDPARFYAMTLSGAQGRAVVRDWLETTVAEVYTNLADHFRDLTIVRNTSPPKGKAQSPAVPLNLMLNSLAAPGQSDPPAALSADFVRAAITRCPYPIAILQKALLRERAEAGGDEWIDSARRDARASLIKGVLIRHFQMEVTPVLDPANRTPGYLLGRLLAVLEDTQRLAHEGRVNATIKDKYYGAASATPAAVFPSLMDLFHKHVRKARETRAEAVVNREKEVDAILAELQKIPVHLDLPGQGMFVLGYHHQRHALFNKVDTTIAG